VATGGQQWPHDEPVPDGHQLGQPQRDAEAAESAGAEEQREAVTGLLLRPHIAKKLACRLQDSVDLTDSSAFGVQRPANAT
jgi:hypothetical protein